LQIEHVQKFINKFRANNKRASLVQSRIKMLEKMTIVDAVLNDPQVIFEFPCPENLSPPMMKLDECLIGYS
jgi:ATP-binding cassette subfamily F protein 3